MTLINATNISSGDISTIVQNHYVTGQPAMFWGPPGIGKTEGVRKAAQDLGLPCVTETVSTHGEGSCGLPVVNFDTLTHTTTQPDWFPSKPSILFLDELAEAPSHLRVPLYRLVLEGKLRDDLALPEGSLVIGAGNRTEDGSLYGDFPPALMTRFCHYMVQVEPEQWLNNYAIPSGVHTAVVGFIKARPDLLLTRDDNMAINPNPRTWAGYINTALNRGLMKWSSNHILSYCIGNLGESTGTAFFQHLQDVVKLPDPIALLKMKSSEWKTHLPTRLSSLYSLAYSVPSVCHNSNQYLRAFELMHFIGGMETDSSSNNREVAILGYLKLSERMFSEVAMTEEDMGTLLKNLKNKFPEVLGEISQLNVVQQGKKVFVDN